MDKVHVALTILSIIILAGPLLGIMYVYRDNIAGLVFTPEIRNLSSGDFSSSQFQRPVPAGDPQYDPASGQYTFSFKFTNPLQNEISVDRITADVYCKDHDVELGSASIDQPMKIAPGETVVLNACGTWTPQALNHFRDYHNGPEDDDINISFKDLNVDLAGIRIHMAELEDAGWVMLPK